MAMMYDFLNGAAGTLNYGRGSNEMGVGKYCRFGAFCFLAES
jgi:hypothetical protein